MKLGMINVAIHQKVSFSKVFAKMEVAENIFWPGCAILSLGEEIVNKTYEQLKTAIPDLGYSSFCCGKPSMSIGDTYTHRNSQIMKAIKHRKVKRIYTLCPNCENTLRDNTDIEVISAWTILDEHFPASRIDTCKGKTIALHDPCPSRNATYNHEATRSILAKLGINVLEFPNNRDKTMCCGKKDMMYIINPEMSKKVFSARAKQAPSSDITSYCASCVHSFNANKFLANHILELLWGVDSKGSWMKRLKMVKGIK